MRPILFGENRYYVIDGEDVMARYHKRMEIMREEKTGNDVPDMQLLMVPGQPRTIVIFSDTAEDKSVVVNMSAADMVEDAIKNGRLIDLDA